MADGVDDQLLQAQSTTDLLPSKDPEAGEEEESHLTRDGTVDRYGRPADKRITGGWRTCPYILGNECSERLAFYGVNINLVVYLKSKLHQTNTTASINVNNWAGTCYITPLIGAFLADSYLGRYWTIAAFSSVYFAGMLLLTLSASVSALKPPTCLADPCPTPGVLKLVPTYVSLYLIALGTGGIKPCVSSFGADQFDDEDPAERKYKTNFFNWFYFCINVGALISGSFLVYIQQSVSWVWGFGIPTAAMGIAIVSFFLGSRNYRHQKPGGSPLARIAQVFVAAIRKWRVPLPSDKNLLHELSEGSGIQGSRKLQLTENFGFLDKAAVVEKNHPQTKWTLCTVTQVEEVKILLRIIPIWTSSIIFSTVYAQMSTLFVVQGQKMNFFIKSFKIPAASLSIFDTLSVLLWVPIYDRLLVPFLRRYTGKPQGLTQLQRMGVGLFISTLSMVAAAVLEIKRLETARAQGIVDADDEKHPEILRQQLSIFWQVPQYFIIGAAEVFTFIGQLEFFYEQAPDAMRSVASALSLTTVALGSYLSSLLVTLVTSVTKRGENPGWIAENINHGHIDYFFWLLAAMSVLNIFFYWPCARWFKYKATTK